MGKTSSEIGRFINNNRNLKKLQEENYLEFLKELQKRWKY